jgi:hypothetical protein
MTPADIEADRKAGTPGPWEYEEIAPDDPDWGACEIWSTVDKSHPVSSMTNTVADARRIARVPDLEDAYLEQAARIRVLEARVRELESGLRVREGWWLPLGHPCATQGCDRPSTVHFVRGGVGTDYCGDCYLKVQSVIGGKP